MKKNTINLSKDLSLPIDIGSQAISIVGIRGSGKTNTGGVIAEELLKIGNPLCIIDPTDAWWGLRSSRDGKREGFPVMIFGGAHGDLPLSESDGKTIAEFIIQERVSVILSLRHLRKNAQKRLVTELCEEMYHLKGKAEYRHPMTVIIDESPQFIPQRVMGETARMVGAVQDLIVLGRSSGFGVIIIGQRPATINKDVLTQCDTIIAHRLPSPQDRKALKEWIEENTSMDEMHTVLSSLPSMKNGEAYIWSPLLDLFERTKVRQKESFDSSATPKIGEKVIAPKKLAEIDKEKLKEKLSASIEKAKENDPVDLKRRIMDLERQIKSGGLAKAIEVERLKVVEVPVFSANEIERLSSVATEITQALSKAQSIKQQAQVARQTPVISTTPKRVVPHLTPNGNGSKSTLPKGELAIMKAIAQYPNGASREQLTQLTGYKRASRDAYILRLKGKGFITGDLTPTQSGIDALGGNYEPLPTREALIQYWLNKLPKGQKVYFFIAVNNDGNWITKSEADTKTNFQRSSRDAYLNRLRARNLIEVKDGAFRAHPDLYK